MIGELHTSYSSISLVMSHPDQKSLRLKQKLTPCSCRWAGIAMDGKDLKK
jgi:hypothetical protein